MSSGEIAMSVIDGETDGKWLDPLRFLDFLVLGPNGMVFETGDGSDRDGWWWAVITARGCVDGNGADGDLDGKGLPFGGLMGSGFELSCSIPV